MTKKAMEVILVRLVQKPFIPIGMTKETVLVFRNLPRGLFSGLMQYSEVIFPEGERFSNGELVRLLFQAGALIPT